LSEGWDALVFGGPGDNLALHRLSCSVSGTTPTPSAFSGRHTRGGRANVQGTEMSWDNSPPLGRDEIVAFTSGEPALPIASRHITGWLPTSRTWCRGWRYTRAAA